MNSCDLRFPTYDAAARHASIRWTLFAHPAVADVLPTLRKDTLRVRHRGAPDAVAWRALLADAGFPAPDVDAAPTAPAGAARRAG